MSILSEKYNVSEDTIKRMMRDGVVSCSWDVCDTIKKMRDTGKSWDEVSFQTGMSIRNCQYIIKKAK